MILCGCQGSSIVPTEQDFDRMGDSRDRGEDAPCVNYKPLLFSMRARLKLVGHRVVAWQTEGSPGEAVTVVRLYALC